MQAGEYNPNSSQILSPVKRLLCKLELLSLTIDNETSQDSSHRCLCSDGKRGLELQKGQLRLVHRESGNRLGTGLLLGYLPQSTPTPQAGIHGVGTSELVYLRSPPIDERSVLALASVFGGVIEILCSLPV